jgi:hypothetical protein
MAMARDTTRRIRRKEGTAGAEALRVWWLLVLLCGGMATISCGNFMP